MGFKRHRSDYVFFFFYKKKRKENYFL